MIPAAILASIAVPTVRGVFELTECGEGAYPVEIIGHQWWFEYRYPQENIETANVLVIPAGREVCASMTSEDVLAQLLGAGPQRQALSGARPDHPSPPPGR